MKPKIVNVRACGATVSNPDGETEVTLEFPSPQSHPNFGEGWGLGDFGTCNNYQGLRSPSDRSLFSGVIAYFRGPVNLPTN